MIFLVSGCKIGHFGPAEAAPGGPEIDQDPSALSHIFAQHVGIAVRVGFHEVPERLADVRLPALAALFPPGVGFGHPAVQVDDVRMPRHLGIGGKNLGQFLLSGLLVPVIRRSDD